MQQLRLYIFTIVSLLIAHCSLFTANVNAQNRPYIEKLVTINAVNQTYSEIFKNISSQTGVVFSYTQFNDKQKITKAFYKKPLRIILNDMFPGTPCGYKINDKYIIIRCKESAKTNPAPPLELKGYVYSLQDSSSLENVSIYLKQNKKSTLSDKYGYFQLSFSASQPAITLSFAKENYKDTSLVIYNYSKKELTIYLYPKVVQKVIKDTIFNKPVNTDTLTIIELPADTNKRNELKDKLKSLWGLLKNNANFRNINDTLFSKLSFSVIPGISTNRLLAINTVNKVSFNLFAGSSKGIDICEIGGLLNIDNGDVRYCQFAGLGNIVSGNVKGAQFAGLFNINSKKTTGFQAAGLYNYTGRMDGMQVAGLVNNTSERVDVAQVSGLINIADTISGFQLSGLANIAGCIRGCQVAGLINIAKRNDGFQLSFINIADTGNGYPLAFFSFIKQGYHKIEFSQDELTFSYVAFRSGVDKLHNIFFAGRRVFANSDIWTYGYGLGTALKMNNKFFFVSELTSQQIQKSPNSDIHFNLLSKLHIGLEYRILRKISIALGPTYNIIVSDTQGKDYLDVNNEFYPHSFFTHTPGKTDIRMWFGAKLSIKFF
ncbi:MAG: hypothetical protein KA792_07970 [Bacteroidales bacterium]|nr:hypothetical protein [Bacteroidales bacterium]